MVVWFGSDHYYSQGMDGATWGFGVEVSQLNFPHKVANFPYTT